MFRPGDLVGIKSKCCGHAHDAYHFNLGEEITFENITWTRQARGVLRGGISKVRWVMNKGLASRLTISQHNERFTNIRIPKEHREQCLSTPGGGPQVSPTDFIFIIKRYC